VLNSTGIAYSQCAGNQQSIAEGKLTGRVQQGDVGVGSRAVR
jgi:hypothetical protein